MILGKWYIDKIYTRYESEIAVIAKYMKNSNSTKLTLIEEELGNCKSVCSEQYSDLTWLCSMHFFPQ